MYVPCFVFAIALCTVNAFAFCVCCGVLLSVLNMPLCYVCVIAFCMCSVWFSVIVVPLELCLWLLVVCAIDPSRCSGLDLLFACCSYVLLLVVFDLLLLVVCVMCLTFVFAIAFCMCYALV